MVSLLQSPTGLTKVCELLEAKHGTLDVCTMLALQTKQQQQQSENSPSVPHVEGISSDDISGSSSSFHYCYYYAVEFVTTLFTSLSAKLSAITIDWEKAFTIFLPLISFYNLLATNSSIGDFTIFLPLTISLYSMYHGAKFV